jgi:hypothetical protein
MFSAAVMGGVSRSLQHCIPGSRFLQGAPHQLYEIQHFELNLAALDSAHHRAHALLTGGYHCLGPCGKNLVDLDYQVN